MSCATTPFHPYPADRRPGQNQRDHLHQLLVAVGLTAIIGRIRPAHVAPRRDQPDTLTEMPPRRLSAVEAAAAVRKLSLSGPLRSARKRPGAERRAATGSPVEKAVSLFGRDSRLLHRRTIEFR